MQLTLRDAAGLLHVDEDQIVRWINEANLPASRINEQYRINRAQLLEWATSSGVRLSPRIFAEEDGNGHTLPTLAGALVAGGILYDVPGADAKAALAAVVDRLPLPEDMEREFLLGMLLAREQLGSTGVGDGIAIPHVRNPIVLHVPSPTVTLSFLAQGVDFGAMDGRPVHTLFTLICPTVKTHLHLLSRLAFALRDPDLRKLIGARAAADEIKSRVTLLEVRLAETSTGVMRRDAKA